MTTERSERRSRSVALDFVHQRLVPDRQRGRTVKRSHRNYVGHTLLASMYVCPVWKRFALPLLALLLLDILVLGDTGLIFSLLYVGDSISRNFVDFGMQFAIAPLVGAGIVAAGASLVNSFMGGQQSRRNTDRTIRENRSLANLAYARDVEMWNRTNEYNSPEMQMMRLRKAGLNPNLVYGGGAGGAAGSAPSSMPKYNAPTAQYNYLPVVDVSSAISAYQDMQMRQAQTDNLKAARNLTEQKYLTEGFLTRMKARRNLAEHTLEFDPQNMYTDAVRAEYQLKRTKADLAKGLGDYQLEFAKGRTKAQDTQIQKMIEDMKRTSAATEFTKLQNEWYVTKMIGQFGLGLAKQVGNMFPAAKVGKSLPSFNPATNARRNFDQTSRDLMRGRFRD